MHNSNEKNATLVISKAGKKALSKNQQEFNKLTQKIEKLQIEIEKKRSRYDLAIKKFGTELHPLKSNLVTERREHIILLWKHFIEKKLSKSNQQYLKKIISEQLEFLFKELETEPDTEIKHIFKNIENEDLDELIKQGEAEANKEIVATLKNLGIDLSDIDITDTESLQRKLYENWAILQEATFDQNNDDAKSKNGKRKSTKQLAAEKLQQEADELQKKDISTIYKQLAKLFHPDLEQDEERKGEKMLLMQELTAAYEAKNLHALLRLELRWIHNENNHLDSLTEEKLAVYLKILKDQVTDLINQKSGIVYQPQYAVLLHEFGMVVTQSPVELVLLQIENTHEEIELLKGRNELFNTDQALRYINIMIKDWKEIDQEEDDYYDIVYGKYR